MTTVATMAVTTEETTAVTTVATMAVTTVATTAVTTEETTAVTTVATTAVTTEETTAETEEIVVVMEATVETVAMMTTRLLLLARTPLTRRNRD